MDKYTLKLSAWLKTEAAKSRKQRRTLKQLHLELRTLGYEGSYDRVAAFARRWKVDQLERVNSASKSTSWGYTDVTNPCIGVKGFKEKSRDRYVSDDEYDAMWRVAHASVQDAMDLALCTGQRPADVLKISVADIFQGNLQITQNKTGKKLRIRVEGELAHVIARIMSRPRDAKNQSLLQDANGRSLTYFALRSRFDKARELSGVNFQFRDLRAKAATDTEDLAHAQRLLGHRNRSTTEIYTRDRKGDFVLPFSKSSTVTERD